MSYKHIEWIQARQQTYDSSGTSGDLPSPGVYEAVAKCLFYRLPFELRRKILIFAFGNYTYHLGIMDARADQDLMFIYGKSECLKWFGGIFPRDPSETPYEDWCRASTRNEYKSMEDISVMGWLCSCRLGFAMCYKHAEQDRAEIRDY